MRKQSKRALEIKTTRHQVPLAPERVSTYNGQQGKTCKGPENEPVGHTIDLRKPSYLSDEEYRQHLYMILGRAKALRWMLFHNFPMTGDDSLNWSWFETGPPKYINAFSSIANTS